MDTVDTADRGQIRRPRNLKQLLIFLGIFNAITFAFHFWLYSVYETALFAEPVVRSIIIWLLIFGFFSIPLSFVSSLLFKRGRSHPISWFGFIWLGVFLLMIFVTAVFQFFPGIFPQGAISALLLIVALSAVALINGLRDPKIKNIPVAGFSEFKGLRIAQLTDVHLGMLYIDEKWWARQIARVNALKVDVLVITGDLVEGGYEQVSDMVRMCSQFTAEKKYFITGNHEYIHGGEVWPHLMQDLGFTVLHNSHKIIDFKGEKFMLAGVPDRMGPRFLPGLISDPDQALKTSEAVGLKILLAHEPASVQDCKQEKPDIILTGHTHGGQIFPFGLLVRLAQPVVMGWKTIRGMRVYANVGTGFWGPPMRLGTRSEIAVLEFT